ncbi:tripartite tricarboxylate transporter substrate binding protein [Variovorax sp. 770b2]|uniref:Bug family tripartite tricarboxylate transporter substrate binding protein n=1 Tax=Variovorax sp. 770b2 TaxID=1566271 RepID=UPI000A599968|nr:tripartite tricarboxylate transporter substrate-binding protein [Variovorax sp. 770b2]
MKRRVFLAAALACGTLPSLSQANGYPDKPIRLIVLFSPGGTADIVARLVSDKMSAALGVTVVVDNRAGGAGGSVGTGEIMRAKPDGCTLGMATVGTLGTAPAAARHPVYDPGKSFSFISNLGRSPMHLAVGPAATATDLAKLLAQVRKQPANSISFAIGGSGGVAHLMGARFQFATGTHLTHVPYRGASPAINDVAGGQVPILFDALTSSTPFIASGRLHALAVSGDHRTASLLQVPTFKELGLPQVSTQAWYGLIDRRAFRTT